MSNEMNEEQERWSQFFDVMDVRLGNVRLRSFVNVDGNEAFMNYGAGTVHRIVDDLDQAGLYWPSFEVVRIVEEGKLCFRGWRK